MPVEKVESPLVEAPTTVAEDKVLSENQQQAEDMKAKFKDDLDGFNAQAQTVFDAQKIADKRAVQRKNELEGTISEVSKYYVPKTLEPPHIFSRPSAAAASKDKISNEIVQAMDHQDKMEELKEKMDGAKEADIIKEVQQKNAQFGGLLNEK